MSSLFISILNMSLKASYVMIIVMLIRLLLKKAPKFISYALWGVVAFRLTVPFSFESILSIMPKTRNTDPIPRDIVIQRLPQIKSGTETVDPIINNSVPGPNVSASVNSVQMGIFIASCIWIIGIMALLAYSLISVIRLKKRLKDAHLLEDNIFEVNNLQTPFVFGIVKPRIYLPGSLDTLERTYIILHEQTHIRRKDNVIKIIAFIILAIHWFNPLVWIAFILMCADMEFSCDEHVLKVMKEDIKKPYAYSLLSLSAGGHIINGSPLAFGEGNIKGRIKNVLSYKKPSFWIIAVSIIAVIVISLALISNPRYEHSQKNDINITDGKEEYASGDTENQDAHIPENSARQEGNKTDISSVETGEVFQTEYREVKIKLVSDMMGFDAAYDFETSNYRVVSFINWVLRGGERVSAEVDLNSNYINQYQIILSNDLSESSYLLYYDTLYDKAYFKKYEGIYEVVVDFARYIDSFFENADIDLDIDDKDALDLFEGYGWTLNYKINSIEQKINNINTLSGFNPNAYYFAYNNELSKDIGLDMSGYSNTSDIMIFIGSMRVCLRSFIQHRTAEP